MGRRNQLLFMLQSDFDSEDNINFLSLVTLQIFGTRLNLPGHSDGTGINVERSI